MQTTPSVTARPASHQPQDQPDGFAPSLEDGQHDVDAFKSAAIEVGQLGSRLAIELALDDRAVETGEQMTLDEIEALARDVAHAGNVVLSFLSRACVRCGGGLRTWTDKQTGYCQACRNDFRAASAALNEGGGREE